MAKKDKKGQGNSNSNAPRPQSSSSLSQSNPSISTSTSSSQLTCFSANASLYAQVQQAVDADTVRVYDVGTTQCVSRWTSTGGASDRVTAIEWVELESASAGQEGTTHRGKKRRKSSTNETSNGNGNGNDGDISIDASNQVQAQPLACLALGLKSGSIHILHPTRSTILHTLSHSFSTSEIIDLRTTKLSSSSNGGNYLWACAGGKLQAWALPSSNGLNGRLHATYDLQGSSWKKFTIQHFKGESYRVLATTHSISLFEVSLPSTQQPPNNPLQLEGSLKATFTGHTSQITDVQFLSTSATHFLTIAKSDRFVNVWSVPSFEDSQEPVEGSLFATLGLEEDATKISVSSFDSTTLCAVSATGPAVLASLDAALASQSTSNSSSSEKKKRRKSAGLISLTPLTIINTPKSNSFADVVFTSDRAVRLAVGTIKPAFEEVSYKNADGTHQATVQVKDRSATQKLVATDAGAAQSTTRATYAETSQSAVLPSSAVPVAAPTTQTNGKSTSNEPTLAQRLKALQVREAQEEGRASSSKPARPIADASSLSQTLVQALHSSDSKLLESCLNHSDAKTIRATVKRLPNTLVVPLIDALVTRLHKSKSGFGTGAAGVDAHRGAILIEWLRHVLIVHLTYLITVPSLSHKLASLYSTLDARLSTHSQLLSLNGRLDLVVSQIDLYSDTAFQQARSHKAKSADPEKKDQKAVGVTRYVEGESEDEEEESEEDDEDEADEVSIVAAEEGGDIEDLVLDQAESDEEESEEEEEEDDEEPVRQPKSAAKLNGYLDIEAEESDDEDEDGEDGDVVGRVPKFPIERLVNGNADNEDDEDDLDRYESDFINDDSESEGEDSEEDDDDDE